MTTKLLCAGIIIIILGFVYSLLSNMDFALPLIVGLTVLAPFCIYAIRWCWRFIKVHELDHLAKMTSTVTLLEQDDARMRQAEALVLLHPAAVKRLATCDKEFLKSRDHDGSGERITLEQHVTDAEGEVLRLKMQLSDFADTYQKHFDCVRNLQYSLEGFRENMITFAPLKPAKELGARIRKLRPKAPYFPDFKNGEGQVPEGMVLAERVAAREKVRQHNRDMWEFANSYSSSNN
jgi:hypothetical protein